MPNLIPEATKIVTAAGYCSTLLLCESLDIGYSHARQIIDALRGAGILGRYHDGKFELLRLTGFY